MTSSVPNEAVVAAAFDAVNPAAGRPEPSALGARIRSGLAWKAASQLTAQVSRVAMTIILARLLTPADFGIAGMVLVFSGLIQLLSDVGFSSSLIQFKSITEKDSSTAFWTGLGIASTLFFASFAIAPAVASFYRAPQLRWMFVAVCTGFLTTALSTTQASLLWRRMEFRALEIRGIVATIAAASVGITAATLGFGAWSLILQANAMSLTSMVAIWALSPWKPRFIFSRASLRRMARFSTNVFLARFLAYGDRNVDNLLVGRVLGSTSLGIYSIGYSAILVPFDRLIFPIQNVASPALASLQDDLARMRAVWLRAVRLIAAVSFPALAGVIIVCPDLVSIVFGRRWEPAVPIIQILAWVAAIQSLTALSPPVYQARYRSGLLLRVAALGFTLDLAAFVVGLHWGVRGVATAYALTNTLVIVPVSLAILIRLIELPLSQLAKELRGVVEATTAMALCTFLLRRLLESMEVGAAMRLAVVVLAGATVYSLICLWREPRILQELPRRQLSVRFPFFGGGLTARSEEGQPGRPVRGS